MSRFEVCLMETGIHFCACATAVAAPSEKYERAFNFDKPDRVDDAVSDGQYKLQIFKIICDLVADAITNEAVRKCTVSVSLCCQVLSICINEVSTMHSSRLDNMHG